MRLIFIVLVAAFCAVGKSLELMDLLFRCCCFFTNTFGFFFSFPRCHALPTAPSSFLCTTATGSHEHALHSTIQPYARRRHENAERHLQGASSPSSSSSPILPERTWLWSRLLPTATRPLEHQQQQQQRQLQPQQRGGSSPHP